MTAPKILVIEDEETLRESIRRVLTKEGLDVDVTENAESALCLIDNKPYDIILTDIILPGISGVEFLAKCKALHPSLKIIVMTAYASIETVVLTIKMGAIEYLTKPFMHEELIDCIKKTLGTPVAI